MTTLLIYFGRDESEFIQPLIVAYKGLDRFDLSAHQLLDKFGDRLLAICPQYPINSTEDISELVEMILTSRVEGTFPGEFLYGDDEWQFGSVSSIDPIIEIRCLAEFLLEVGVESIEEYLPLKLRGIT